ncbi:hypothetical protein ES711_00915 [Gelidibacter salicanalis]|uniref:Uncharacterized protein n=1 Tax=Gelidibacter salicanalis TaxID=291193 RepID=A0A5C7AQ40_9FLAO|nr:hypothetical protein [Gelidibacter salicanalis]TXE10501.1 hypothetical protein ES711_00915 [Gelidibacter salicanalis]
MSRRKHNAKSFLNNSTKAQDKKIYIDFVRKTVLTKLNVSYSELKRTHSQDRIFFLALQHVTATKKAICTAFDLEVERQCRNKRDFEKSGQLVQTLKRHKCKFTGEPAHYLTTDKSKFNEILCNFKR